MKQAMPPGTTHNTLKTVSFSLTPRGFVWYKYIWLHLWVGGPGEDDIFPASEAFCPPLSNLNPVSE